MSKPNTLNSIDLELLKQRIIKNLERDKYHVVMQSSQDYLEKATDANAKEHVGHAHYLIGRIIYFSGDYPTALKSFKLAITIYKEIDLKKNIEATLIAKAACQSLLEQYDLSIKTYNEALTIVSKDIVNKASIFNNIGSQYKQAGDNDQALLYFEKAISMLDKEQEEHQSLYYQSLGNVGKMRWEAGRMEEAEALFHEVKTFADKSHLYFLQANSLLGLGRCAWARLSFKEAEDRFQESMVIAERYKIKPMYLQSKINLASLLLQRNELSNMENTLVDSYSLAVSFYPHSVREILNLLIQYYEKIGKNDLAQIFTLEVKNSETLSRDKLVSLIS